ncbi:MAG: YraN family protein [Bacteroidia bacterium]
MAEHLKTGKEGEEASIAYLRKMGFTILETNWRFKKLEIDIIAMEGDTLVAVEVKTRSTAVFGEPEVFVTKGKQGKLVKAINHYVNGNGMNNEIRFDVVAVLYQDGGTSIKHIIDAFYPAINAR